jgi:uncharacterized protein YjiS (DUF1127 family)
MTCDVHAVTEFSIVESKPSSFARRLISAFRRLRPLQRLDLDGLSSHQLRDLGLADGHAAPPRDLIRD